jgi:hypothetical protein
MRAAFDAIKNFFSTEFSKTLFTGGVGGLVGAAAIITTGAFGYFNRDRELDIQMVHVGLSILKADVPEDSTLRNKNARRFALRLLKKYAAVDMPETEFEEWAEKGTLPLEEIPPNFFGIKDFGAGSLPRTLKRWAAVNDWLAGVHDRDRELEFELLTEKEKRAYIQRLEKSIDELKDRNLKPQNSKPQAPE